MYDRHYGNILMFIEDLRKEMEETQGLLIYKGVLVLPRDCNLNLPITDKVFKLYDLIYKNPGVFKFQATDGSEFLNDFNQPYEIITGPNTKKYVLTSINRKDTKERQRRGQLHDSSPKDTTL